ncbi:MAG: hypothetical protein ACSHX7_01740 [Luteolibacter sp.]
MNTKQAFQLIDGTFTPAEANHLLGDLVTSKVNYHRMQKYSHGETGSEGVSPSEKKLQHLNELKQQLDEIFTKASTSDQNLCVKGWIEITPAAE